MHLSSPSRRAIILIREQHTGRSVLGFLARLAITLALEIGLALAFGYGIKPVLIINLITQIGLNLALFFCARWEGSWGFMFYGFYVFLEIVIFLVEWAFYRDRLPETNPSHPGKDRVLLYAFLANALSFGAGVLLNMLWPIAF